ncbi:MAG: 50S ribosomal protein L29 [Candidatus Magasanikbacteria bacterium GW2011_GWD2_43_18]|nr:MAG: 50S ribosomal protein L29 [Candidatus Magasanikbacteria bacterium GW2011_GWC2_42_27]KKT04295.1 MAG: 50S ribosomal protein L29 [Candidatus Magasanikbacteria bacterium GW2011_GWD2_43_18]KKT24870.1 MAG: 50S ribosomal protein L29 [Candidatus Magasanikbacteria bacterium GW2011_GWA2_43_9]HBB38361.1 50S ribosomal protein L29 [Candidatus Magasanikbacteria bacterium]HCC14129.1 50S ribosomal protein L29 [Candidatus Magasanikbacteria bacterium]
MELVELKQKTGDDLKTLLIEQRAHLKELQFQAHEGQLKQIHTIKQTKKVIAQILTLLNVAASKQ